MDPYELTRVADVMVDRVDTLPETATCAELVAFFAQAQRHKAYPVVDAAGRPIAMASRADALRLSHGGKNDVESASATLAQVLGGRPLVTATPDERLSALVDRMVHEGAGRVPVVRPEDGVLVGIVARKDLLRVRARWLAEEHDRASFFRLRRSRPVRSAA